MRRKLTRVTTCLVLAACLATTVSAQTGLMFPGGSPTLVVGGVQVMQATPSSITFTTGGAQRMVIDQLGHVGIGTADPLSRLDIRGGNVVVHGEGGTFPGYFVHSYGSGVGQFITLHSRGTLASPTFTQTGDRMGGLSMRSHEPGGRSTGSDIRAFATENHTATSAGSDLRFYTVLNGTETTSHQRMRIDHDGKVSIGGQSPRSGLHISSSLEANPLGAAYADNQILAGRIRVPLVFDGQGLAFSNSVNGSNYQLIAANNDTLYFGTATGSSAASLYGTFSSSGFSVTGAASKPGGGSWATTSDGRLKDVNGDYTRGLAEISQLKPVHYRYKKDNPREEPSDKAYVGLVAQDVLQVFPEAVSKAEDGFYTLDSTPITFAVINAIKELQAENDRLRSEHSRRFDQLEADLKRIKR